MPSLPFKPATGVFPSLPGIERPFLVMLVISVLISLIVLLLLMSMFSPSLAFAVTVTVGVVPSAPTVTSILFSSPRN